MKEEHDRGTPLKRRWKRKEMTVMTKEDMCREERRALMKSMIKERRGKIDSIAKTEKDEKRH